jgi:hypothetical protein
LIEGKEVYDTGYQNCRRSEETTVSASEEVCHVVVYRERRNVVRGMDERIHCKTWGYELGGAHHAIPVLHKHRNYHYQ